MLIFVLKCLLFLHKTEVKCLHFVLISYLQGLRLQYSYNIQCFIYSLNNTIAVHFQSTTQYSYTVYTRRHQVQELKNYELLREFGKVLFVKCLSYRPTRK